MVYAPGTFGARRFRAFVVGLPTDSALARSLAEVPSPAAPPSPSPELTPPGPRVFDPERARAFAAAHGGEVVFDGP